MGFIGQPDFSHQSSEKIGVLITNLGTPARPDKRALRAYLKEFLSDHRVVEIPRAIWWFILNGIILNTRPKASAELYKSVWTEKGSPLYFHTQAQCEALRSRLDNGSSDSSERSESHLIVDFAMRYGEPAINKVIQSMQNRGATRIVVLPLYPQYASSTTGSTFDAVAGQLQKMRWVPELRFVSQYCDQPEYITACATAIKKHWEAFSKAEKLILSFHGIPKFSLEKGDPYYCQCQKTSRLIAAELNLGEDEFITTFQSRFGRAEWLQPYTDKTLSALPSQGVKSVDIFCPGFSADCLETLEEIAVENKHYFIDAGGLDYRYIPALNANQDHIEALATIVENNIADWREQLELKDQTNEGANARRKRYEQMTPGYPKTIY